MRKTVYHLPTRQGSRIVVEPREDGLRFMMGLLGFTVRPEDLVQLVAELIEDGHVRPKKGKRK